MKRSPRPGLIVKAAKSEVLRGGNRVPAVGEADLGADSEQLGTDGAIS